MSDQNKLTAEERDSRYPSHPARKIFDEQCWRLFGMTFDSLCKNEGNQQSGFWIDIIMPSMLEYYKSQTAEKDARISELDDSYQLTLKTSALLREQRDEAVRYLKRWLRGENKKQLESEIEGYISRLPSGETKTVCKMCNDKRMVGHMTTEGGETYPCPDCCNTSNNSSSSQDTRAISLLKRIKNIEDLIRYADPVPMAHVGEAEAVNSVLNELNDFLSISSNQPEIPDSSSKSPWISVEDRMPVILENFWGGAYDEDGDWQQWRLMSDYNDLGDQIAYIQITGEETIFTHWMPLPAPPESLTDKLL